MTAPRPETRRASSALFGAEKLAEVVLAFEAERPGAVPLKHLADRTSIPRNLLNPVLARLVDAGALRQLPRPTSRGPVDYEVADEQQWTRLVHLCAYVARAEQEQPLTNR